MSNSIKQMHCDRKHGRKETADFSLKKHQFAVEKFQGKLHQILHNVLTFFIICIGFYSCPALFFHFAAFSTRIQIRATWFSVVKTNQIWSLQLKKPLVILLLMFFTWNCVFSFTLIQQLQVTCDFALFECRICSLKHHTKSEIYYTAFFLTQLRIQPLMTTIVTWRRVRSFGNSLTFSWGEIQFLSCAEWRHFALWHLVKIWQVTKQKLLSLQFPTEAEKSSLLKSISYTLCTKTHKTAFGKMNEPHKFPKTETSDANKWTNSELQFPVFKHRVRLKVSFFFFAMVWKKAPLLKFTLVVFSTALKENDAEKDFH